jgi:hypothetical protein
MQVFGHGHGDANAQWVAGGSVAVQHKVSCDGSVRDADSGTGRAAERDEGVGVADGSPGNGMSGWAEMRAQDLNLSAGHGGGGGNEMEMWGVGVGMEKAH